MDSAPASTVISCPCGVKVRLPEQSGQRSFRCPKCQVVFATTADAHVITAYPLPSGSAVQTCPICQSAIAAGEKAIICPSCAQVHHEECWIEVRGCATYGCVQAPAPEKDAVATPPLTAWGDTKTCPVCGETIKSIALKCRYCQAEFDSVDPMTVRDLQRKDRNADTQRQLQNSVIILFGTSLLLGFLAPLLLSVSLIFVLRKRKQLAAAGPFYLIVGYSAIGLSALYSILMLLFYLFGGQ